MKTDTAYYVFDLGRVRERIAYLRQLLGTEVSLAYAVKANTFIIEGMIPYVQRLEVCSPGEAAICERLGVPPEKMVISGVYKTPSFIERSVISAPGRIYTVESLTQFDLLRGSCPKSTPSTDSNPVRALQKADCTT